MVPLPERRGPTMNRIRYRRYLAGARHCCNQNLLPLAIEFRRQQTDARDVAARMGERCHEPFRDHIFGHSDQRYRAGDRLKRTQRKRGTGDDRVGRGSDQSRRQLGKMIVADLETTRKHLKILALDKTVEAKLIE
jgi:hypothetical protein